MTCAWKSGWPEVRRHFIDWWRREGLVLHVGIRHPDGPVLEVVEDPGSSGSLERRWTDADWRARSNHYRLSRGGFGGDVLPIADTNVGPGSLALFLGSEPEFMPSTVWYKPCMDRCEEPERLPPLRFDASSRWWTISEELVRRCAELGRGKYFAGCPDFIENIDILASLRDAQRLLMDMVDRPDWVLAKVHEINRAWFEAYDRVYRLIKDEEGGSAWAAFGIWGPGKTAKVQCDASAMFSPAMFARFVAPALREQCEWLDYSMFHLDGHQCIPHLDILLGIEALDAIEWTPDPQVPDGGDPAWYGMYRRILAAGKSVQAIKVRPEEVLPLLDAVGGRGMFIVTHCETAAEAEALYARAEAYR